MRSNLIWPYGGVTPATSWSNRVKFLTHFYQVEILGTVYFFQLKPVFVPGVLGPVETLADVPLTLSTSSSVPQVEITLQDVNDNPPIFPNDILDVTIEENVGDGFKIMQLTATDADEVTTPRLSLRPDAVFLPVFHSAAFGINAPGVIALEMGLKLSSDSLECYYKFRRVPEARAAVAVETVNHHSLSVSMGF